MNAMSSQGTCAEVPHISTISALVGMISAFGLLSGMVYSWEDCMHGEIEPQVASMLFSPAVWFAARQPLAQNRCHRMVLTVALCCFGLGWFAYLTHIRMGYIDWLVAGMPDQNPNARPMLLVYLVFTVLTAPRGHLVSFQAQAIKPPMLISETFYSAQGERSLVENTWQSSN
jgi:hypothetical protein